MDIKKIEELVEKSELTDEAKDMIFKLLPEADKPEVKEEIMRLIDYEIEMNDAVTLEAEEVISALETGEIMLDAAEKAVGERTDQVIKEADEELNQAEEEMKSIDSEMETVGVVEPEAEAPAEPVSAPVEPVVEAPVAEVAAEPVVPAWQQPAETPEPVAAPQWNQPTMEQQAQPASDQPAPFPSTQTNQ
jgi:exonuclease VII small subunit